MEKDFFVNIETITPAENIGGSGETVPVSQFLATYPAFASMVTLPGFESLELVTTGISIGETYYEDSIRIRINRVEFVPIPTIWTEDSVLRGVYQVTKNEGLEK